MTHPVAVRLAILALASLALAKAEARTMQQIRNEGTLRVGVALATPWALRDSDRELAGFEIDVAKRLAEDMRVEPIIIVHDFEELVPALELGEIDIIAAGFTITAERALHVNFSRPYATSGVVLATNTGSTSGVETLADLNDARFTIAAVSGSVGLRLAQRNFPRAEIVQLESAEEAGQALVEGRADALLEEEPVPTFLALENPQRVDLPLAGPLLATQSGFAIAKGDHDFLAFLNAWIVAREADTWLPTVHDYWFESLHWREARSDAGPRP